VRLRPQLTAFLTSAPDLLFLGGGQRLQREGGRPYGAVVELRLVAEAERRVPRLELLRTLEVAGDLRKSVNPLELLLVAVVFPADFCVSFFGLIETSESCSGHVGDRRAAQRISWMRIRLPA
jgi:hypothetical protein